MSKKDKIISEEQVYSCMARICSQKEYCSYDISQKLFRMNLPEQMREKIVNRLKADNYINEERYVRSFVNDKLRFNKWGRKKIELHLKQKQIPQNIIESIFSEHTDSSLNDHLLPLMTSKWKTIKGETEYIKTGKLIKFALGRGFEMKDILSCLKKMNLSDDL